MQKKIVLFFAFLFIAAFASIAAAQNKFPVGTRLEKFSLPDMSNQTKSFDDLRGANGVVFVFLSAQCPVVKSYNERIVKLAGDYKSKGIIVVGINSNATESLDWIKSYADEHYKAANGYKFPILIDKGNVWADKFDASYTPETLFFNAKGELIYRGAIDNDRSGANVTKSYLRSAMDETLAGKAVTNSFAKGFGCTIKRVGQD